MQIKYFHKILKHLQKKFRSLRFYKSNKGASINYSCWVSKVEKKLLAPLEKVEETGVVFPLFSIFLVDDFEICREDVIQTINSLILQKNTNWSLVFITNEGGYYRSIFKDERIVFHPIDTSNNYYQSIDFVAMNCSSDFLTFLRVGDRLSPYAITLLSKYCNQYPDLQLIVADEDLLNASGQRYRPFFKPDWNPDYLANYNYFSQAVIYKAKLFNDLGGFNGEESDPLHALALKATSRINENQIFHMDKMLFHFKKAINGKVKRIQFTIPSIKPLVTIIIPTRDKLELLKPCIDGLLYNTAYDHFEIIIIDNNSKHSDALVYLSKLEEKTNLTVLRYDRIFNYSDMNNLAVSEAKGELVCFLNNDISIIKDDWLTEMVSQACRPEIGCVGAKLFYPDGTIQHAGVILGLKGYASHAHKGFAGESSGYFNRLVVTHNVSAVTAACMVVRKEIFDEVGGFDAKNLKVAYNDVDFCLKVREAGYRNLFTPHAQLIHHESKSRGKSRNKKQQKQLRKESEYLIKKWEKILYSDPAYNKNLTLLREDFSLGLDRLQQ